MAEAQLTRTWTVNANLRRTFTTLNDQAGWWFFQNFSQLITSGWTVKYTCDGTTGPTSGADHTNRLTTQANCQTRGATAASAQSFAVVTNTDGVDMMITYQGATDDVLRVSYSPGGLYTIATPSTNQPTATDEVIVTSGTSVVNATTSQDRVMTIWTSSNGGHWSCIVFRQSATVICLGIEKGINLTPTGIWVPQPYFCYKVFQFDRNGFPAAANGGPNYDPSANAQNATNWSGVAIRATTSGTSKLIRVIMGGWELCDSPASTRLSISLMASNGTALQGGLMPLLPPIINGELGNGFEGVAGQPIDWWFAYGINAATPALGDFFPGYDPADVPGTDPLRTNWLIALGSSMVRPWRNVAASLQIA